MDSASQRLIDALNLQSEAQANERFARRVVYLAAFNLVAAIAFAAASFAHAAGMW